MDHEDWRFEMEPFIYHQFHYRKCMHIYGLMMWFCVVCSGWKNSKWIWTKQKEVDDAFHIPSSNPINSEWHRPFIALNLMTIEWMSVKRFIIVFIWINFRFVSGSVCPSNIILNRVVILPFRHILRCDEIDKWKTWAFLKLLTVIEFHYDIDYAICGWMFFGSQFFPSAILILLYCFSNLKSKTEISCPKAEFQCLFRNHIKPMNTPNADRREGKCIKIIIIVTFIESSTNIWLSKKIFIDISETIPINLKWVFVLNCKGYMIQVECIMVCRKTDTDYHGW